jgi:hypothetical protein
MMKKTQIKIKQLENKSLFILSFPVRVWFEYGSSLRDEIDESLSNLF